MEERSKARRLVAIIVTTTAIGIGHAFAFADEARADNVADARADYEAGAAAYDRKDYVTAASRFSRADERAPNPRALQLAMAAVSRIDDAALAMNLVERAEARAVDGSLVDLAKRLRARFANEAGRIRLACAADAPRCRFIVDSDDIVDPSLVRWASIGSHKVLVRVDDCLIERSVRVTAGSLSEVSISKQDLSSCAPSPSPSVVAPIESERATASQEPRVEPAPRSAGKLAPAFFWIGVGVTTAGIGAASVLTAVHSSAHDDFVRNPSAETSAAGDSAQTNMIVGWSVAGGLLVTTLVLAIFTDFKGGGRAK